MSSQTEKSMELGVVDLTADPNTLPLEAIPGYVSAIGRRMAVDVWLVGKALTRAKKLVQEAHKAGWREDGWRDWCQTHLGVSHETARKWIKVAEHFDSKDKLQGLTLEEEEVEETRNRQDGASQPEGVAVYGGSTSDVPVYFRHSRRG